MTDLPIEALMFAAMLAGIAVWHRYALAISLGGLALIAGYTAVVGEEGAAGLAAHAAYEWALLVNLALLLLGFAALSAQFEKSRLPERIPRLLPAGWTGGLVLLAMVFVLSIFLDNIAGAVIGGVVARSVYDRVGVAFIAGIVAAANAGGAGSVLGDTTTTMMWISGVSALSLAPAFLPALAAFAVFAPAAAIMQERVHPLNPSRAAAPPVDWVRAGVVAFILLTLLGTNLVGNLYFPHDFEKGPWLGLALWAAILATAPLRPPGWAHLRDAAAGAGFLVALVAAASLMPIHRLPGASWGMVLGAGSCRPCSTTSRLPRWPSSRADTTGPCSPTPWASAVRWRGSDRRPAWR